MARQPGPQPRGTCPICRRNVAVLSDGAIGGARPHQTFKGSGIPCPGHGRKAIPAQREKA